MAQKVPQTTALRALRKAKVSFQLCQYRYEHRGGTAVSSRELGIDEHSIVKTLIFEDDQKNPFVVLMHGDCEVSNRALARHWGVKKTQICVPKTAQKYSGYLVGGTSPFGLKRSMPVLAEASIQDLEVLYINAGRRGLLVEIQPQVLEEVLGVEWVQVAT